MFQKAILILALACMLATTLADTNYRLNSPLTPVHYALAITPYFNTNNDLAFTFDGEIGIVLQTKEENINQIKLHAEDLEFDANNIVITSETSVIGLNPSNPITIQKDYSFVILNLETPLEANVSYTLDISYRGPIRKDLNGFYRSSYVENGVTKWLGATQMEPTHARKVFPCFDEPEYKATFALTIDRPETYAQNLANTKLQASVPLANGYIRDIFYPTPKMSTYLVAFMVSEYTAAEYYINGTKELGVYTRPEAKTQAAYAFDFAKRVEVALSEYLSIDYYSVDEYLKLDHIALPDFRAGAMENWGLIKYREALLLYVPEESTPYYKYRVAQIIAHETVHMWFGNLVTCHWWSNTWLNEGFASYLQDYITSLIEPTVGSADELVIGSVYSAYAVDQVPSAPAITNENVNSPEEISAHFGTVSYQKAGSIIRMMHHLIGDATFKTGLNSYLTVNEFSVGYPELLYSALHDAVIATGSLQQYPGVTIAEVFNSWIAQPGYPVLNVDVNYDTGIITLNQRRFYTNSSLETDELYQIPITYATAKAANFSYTKPAIVMINKTEILNVTDITDHSWILFNLQETGFYRVNYDTHTWGIIAEALKGEDRTKIDHLNRAKVVNDLFAFLAADEVPFSTLYQVLDFLKTETEYAVWNAAITGLNALRTRYIGDSEALSDVDKYILQLMKNVIDHLGYTVKDTDSLTVLRNRMQVLEFACKLGHEGCVDNAMDAFAKFKTGVKVSPSLRPVIYCNGLRYGSAADFEFLWQEMLTTTVANDALVMDAALGCTKNLDKQEEYMLSVTKDDSPIRWQDFTLPITSILADHDNSDVVFKFLKNNYVTLSNSYPSMGTIVSYVASTLHTTTQFEEFETWLDSCTACSADSKTSGKNALASARATTMWANEHRSDVLKALRNGSAMMSPSFSIVALSTLAMLMKTW